VLDRVLTISREGYVCPYWLFAAYVGLGDVDKIVESARAGCDGRESLMLTVKTMPWLDRYRETEWYGEVERMLGD
jgi:hypothetical protein